MFKLSTLLQARERISIYLNDNCNHIIFYSNLNYFNLDDYTNSDLSGDLEIRNNFGTSVLS